jgi:hypothetical protein
LTVQRGWTGGFIVLDYMPRAAEASILRKDGAGRFNAFSAGSHPKRIINPFARKVLDAYRYPTDGVRPKSWDGRFVKEDYQRTVSAEFKDSRTPTEGVEGRPLVAVLCPGRRRPCRSLASQAGIKRAIRCMPITLLMFVARSVLPLPQV